MEYEHQDLSGLRGTAGAGLGLGIAGTALSLLNGNGLGFLNNNNANCGIASFDTYKDIQKQLSDLCVRLAVMESAIAVNGSNLNALTNSYNGLVKTYIPSTSVATVSSTGTSVTG